MLRAIALTIMIGDPEVFLTIGGRYRNLIIRDGSIVEILLGGDKKYPVPRHDNFKCNSPEESRCAAS